MEKNTEILINAGLYETRVALLENSILQEVYIERKSSKGIVGNIYKGHVERVLPGMDAAFINIGLEKNAFLHVKNIVGAVSEGEDKTSILDHVHQGQNILVQVIKDPMGNKGARLSTEISIPSRYVVFLPNSKDIGISTRIEDEALRHHLKDCIAKFYPGYPAVILSVPPLKIPMIGRCTVTFSICKRFGRKFKTKAKPPKQQRYFIKACHYRYECYGIALIKQ